MRNVRTIEVHNETYEAHESGSRSSAPRSMMSLYGGRGAEDRLWAADCLQKEIAGWLDWKKNGHRFMNLTTGVGRSAVSSTAEQNGMTGQHLGEIHLGRRAGHPHSERLMLGPMSGQNPELDGRNYGIRWSNLTLQQHELVRIPIVTGA